MVGNKQECLLEFSMNFTGMFKAERFSRPLRPAESPMSSAFLVLCS